MCSNFSGAGKFCLAYGLRQLTHISDIGTLNFRSEVTNSPPQKTLNDIQRMLFCDVNVKNKRLMNDN